MGFNLDWHGKFNSWAGSAGGSLGDCWTPNYSTHSNSFVLIPTWSVPTCKITFKVTFQDTEGSGDITIAHDSSSWYFGSFYGIFTFVNWDTVKVDGNFIISNNVSIVVGHEYNIELTGTGAYVTYFGGTGTDGESMEGSIKDIRMIDTSGGENSRYYPSTIISEEQPNTNLLIEKYDNQHGTLGQFPVGQRWKKCNIDTAWNDVKNWDDLAYWNNPYLNQ